MALTSSDVIQFAQGDPRVILLTDWVKKILGKNLESIEYASADASFRRYFRIGYKGSSFIVMDSPVNFEEFEAFIRISIKFKKVGLNVPEVYAADYQNGYALLTDFGNTTYLASLSSDTADALYEDALDSLIVLQQATHTDVEFLPPYSSDLLLSEMELFREWYLKENLNIEVNREINEILDDTFSLLLAKAQEQPKVWVHLDYHSRNLMVLDKDNPGIIDFQNAVYGPVSYDLVSLLRDCYLVWDPKSVDKWINLYLKKLKRAQLDMQFDDGQFKEWFDWMGLQRHIKVAGIFSRLNYRDNKPHYLQDIPRVMDYVVSVSKNYPELRSLHNLCANLTEQ